MKIGNALLVIAAAALIALSFTVTGGMLAFVLGFLGGSLFTIGVAT